MESLYLLALAFLLLFAIFDLIVGVSNDAVNFLNSALGSKAASIKTIMITASFGIFLGAVLSSGMMEVARKGVFNPAMFHFSDIIFIFLAVMMADIVLLDIFSTLGLPTSTTVSIVFCILGAALSISLLKLNSSQNELLPKSLSLYINTKGISTIILGIFLSVFISFIAGSLIHYFIRIAFSFHYQKRLKYFGALWVSLSLSSMTYFLIVKGLRNSLETLPHSSQQKSNSALQLLTSSLDWIHLHPYSFWGALLLLTYSLAQILLSLKFNLLRFVVLYGTFSLAMAFAGNDLVNFIGVPIAGFQAYQLWSNSGFSESLTMANLGNHIQTSPIILLGAGLIMVLTLWFSKKAHSVSETELSLGRQEEGNEAFSPSSLARSIVKFARYLNTSLAFLIPKSLKAKLNHNFKPNPQNEHLDFDLIRASANLTISSILIALATSMKLPLSTTFVTFMVAMGTSLSDRAWGRESAVYRITGVLKVIAGWFLTALAAFLLACFAASLLWLLKLLALIPLAALMAFILYKNYKKHSKITQEKSLQLNAVLEIDELTIAKTLNKSANLIALLTDSLNDIYLLCLNGLLNENNKLLENAKKKYTLLTLTFNSSHSSLIKILRKTNLNEPTAGMTYLKLYSESKKILEAIHILSHKSHEHLSNSHKPLKPKQKKSLTHLFSLLSLYLISISKLMHSKNFNKINRLLTKKNTLLNNIDLQLTSQILGIVNKKYGPKNSSLMLDLLLNSKSIIDHLHNLLLLYSYSLTKFPASHNIIHDVKAKNADPSTTTK